MLFANTIPAFTSPPMRVVLDSVIVGAARPVIGDNIFGIDLFTRGVVLETKNFFSQLFNFSLEL
jgi:hypothetical protein